MKMLGSYRYYEFGRTIGMNGVYRESSGPFETHNGSTTVQTGFGHCRHADGTGWYDNAARIYDAVLLRFLTPDPLWRRYLDTAPYTYCLANPLRYLDRDGAQNRQLETMSVGQPMYGLQNVRVPNQLNGTCFVADSFQPVELPDRNAEIPDSEHEIQINAP